MRQRKANSGFTLIELMVVIVILGIIGTMAFVFLLDKPDQAKWSRAQTEMLQIHQALSDYRLDNGDYPADLADLTTQFPNGVPQDPFAKTDFQYDLTEDGFELVCLGKDQADGGEKSPNKDIIVNQAGLVNDNE